MDVITRPTKTYHIGAYELFLMVAAAFTIAFGCFTIGSSVADGSDNCERTVTDEMVITNGWDYRSNGGWYHDGRMVGWADAEDSPTFRTCFQETL